jgi:alcohol dehydrogenase class IV
VREGIAAARASGAELLIGFGGGSVIDAAKAIAALMPNSGEPLDYIEVIGRGRKFEHLPLPWIAVPTTAGTGAEVTRNAVLGSPEHGVKASLRSAHMLARVAVIDPDLTTGLPRFVAATTGLDALTQLIEAYVSIRANAITDALCEEGLARAARSLRRAIEKPDAAARDDMSLAALLSGLALSNAGLGIVHGFAAPLGGMLRAAHGALCAAVLPHGMAANVQALRQHRDSRIARYDRIAQVLTASNSATAEDGIRCVEDLRRLADIPTLSQYGLHADAVSELAAKVERASSTKANPTTLSRHEIEEIARASL